jgi:hypothetical protein
MSAFDYAKEAAERMARLDFNEGEPIDPTKYGAIEISAWAGWYRDEYARQVDLTGQGENDRPQSQKDSGGDKAAQAAVGRFDVGR